MTGHTPGPWVIDGKRIRSKYATLEFSGGRLFATVAQVDKGAVGDQQARANANLISAAPDLLSACQYLLEGLELRGLLEGWTHDPELVERARAAVAKAEGFEP